MKTPNIEKEDDVWGKFGYFLIIILLVGTIAQGYLWYYYTQIKGG